MIRGINEKWEDSQSNGAKEKGALVIVGVGASAGCLAALRALFALMPKDCGLTFVIVVHLSPEHDSLLPELLQSHTELPVHQVRETIRLERSHIYIIPPNANLEAIDTHLRLTELEARRRDRAPIDHFFRTLARTHDGLSVGILLTGQGSDGTQGLKAIKERGGLTIAQDPAEAEHHAMPRSAIAAGAVDLVLRLDEIPEAVLSFRYAEPQLTPPQEGEEPGAGARWLLNQTFALVRGHTGRDFSCYKPSTLLRRMRRRMQLRHIQEAAAYVERLRADPGEVRALADDLLINVTSFFRDPEVFQALEQKVIPRLFDDRRSDEPIRVWSVGCATGEEAYSLAILLLEEAARRQVSPKLQVFASDLHGASLSIGRAGVYVGDFEADLGPERLSRFFIQQEDGYRVKKEVRERVLFTSHDLLLDPPFSRLDLIACRNLLIYLKRAVQSRVMELFHYALQPDRFLVVGSSESAEGTGLFRVEDKERRIYRSQDLAGPRQRMTVFPILQQRSAAELRDEARSAPSGYGHLHARLIEQYGPPSVLLGPEEQVVHLSMGAGRYLVHPGGAPTNSIFRLMRAELQIELRSALSSARRQRSAVRSEPIYLELEGEPVEVVLDLRPALRQEEDGFMLLLFDERPARSRRAQGAPDARLVELSQQKVRSEERLHAIIQEHETSKEELRASYEELQSANEELRSTLEELETSKEELQSVNEELQSVNEEHQRKTEELARISSDLQNLLTATGIATLFLDEQLRILRFTPKSKELFNVRSTDQGRPLGDITHRLGYPELEEDARKVLETLVPIEREAPDEEGRWFLTRLLPYRTNDNRIAGVVVTFVDVTELRSAKEFAEQIIHTLPEPLLVLSTDHRVLSVNAAFCESFRLTKEQAQGKEVYSLADGQWDIPLLRALLERSLPKEKIFTDHEIDHVFEGLGRRVMLLNGRALEGMNLILLGFRDITERKQAEEALRESERNLEKENENKSQYLAMLGHELRNPLGAARSATELLKRLPVKDARLQRAVGVMDRQISHVSRIIDDLLEVSRIGRGKVKVELRTMELREAVQRAIEVRAEHIADQGLSLEWEQEDEAPLWVEADEVRLAQIVDNILGNAIKFTGRRGRITVALERDRGQAVIKVRDTGVGLLPEALERIFASFHQESQGLEHSRGGLGLGLALSKGLVELHGGTIAARSDGIGKGAEFEVRLPLTEAPGGSRAKGHPVQTSPHKILLVEDNADAASALSELLQLKGHQVTICENGPSALEMLKARGAEVIFCDLGLPGMSGYEVASAVRRDEAFQDVFLVALSGYGQPEDRRRTRTAGFDDHLVKPASLEDLEAVIARSESRRERT